MTSGENLHLMKLHGLGNDFLVHITNETGDAGEDSQRARRLCARHHGVGADGLIRAVRGTDPHTWTMILHNADGGRAEMSGNGIRCLAQAIVRFDQLDLPLELNVFTDAGERSVRVAAADPGAEVLFATVDMGAAGAGPVLPTAGLPETVEIHASATVDVGNPHLVLLVDHPEQVDLTVDGPAWEAHFPDGMNVHFIAARGERELDLFVWERGAGVTEACGTGACAAAFAAHQWGIVGERVDVRMPGGTVTIEVGPTISLTGPSQWIADVVVAR